MKYNSADEFYQGIISQELLALSQSISLVESKKAQHQQMARELISKILPLTGKAKRIGISGIPGVGKSTFIENYAMRLIDQGYKVAVLAVDPTSQKTGGSILGDKTRMTKLSAHKDAFIRPSPSGDTLGGITSKTREAMLLCEAYGFDYIFIETVGVGQSEVSVSYLSDLFILLMQPGAGDELQGIKRGIIEVCDLVLINKADGDKEKMAKVSQHEYKRSVDIIQSKKEFETQVLLCSSLFSKGFDEIDVFLKNFYQKFDPQKRKVQQRIWIKDLVFDTFKINYERENKEDIFEKVEKGDLDVLKACESIYKRVIDD